MNLNNRSIPVAIRPLYVRNFKAKLPSDFGMILKLEDELRFQMAVSQGLNDSHNKRWRIQGDYIYFSGKGSKWKIIRVLHFVFGAIFPRKYYIHYYSYNTVLAQKLINSIN